jgi:hypothetical protein
MWRMATRLDTAGLSGCSSKYEALKNNESQKIYQKKTSLPRCAMTNFVVVVVVIIVGIVDHTVCARNRGFHKQ